MNCYLIAGILLTLAAVVLILVCAFYNSNKIEKFNTKNKFTCDQVSVAITVKDGKKLSTKHDCPKLFPEKTEIPLNAQSLRFYTTDNNNSHYEVRFYDGKNPEHMTSEAISTVTGNVIVSKIPKIKDKDGIEINVPKFAILNQAYCDLGRYSFAKTGAEPESGCLPKSMDLSNKKNIKSMLISVAPTKVLKFLGKDNKLVKKYTGNNNKISLDDLQKMQPTSFVID